MNYRLNNRHCMNRGISKQTLFLIFSILIFFTRLSVQGASIIRENNNCKPWMLFVTNLIPPGGPKHSVPFTSACFEQIKTAFDTTSYQAILISTGQSPEKLSNNNKDLIITSEPKEYCIKGKTTDTLIFWIRYKVGFVHSKVFVPYNRGQGNAIPSLVAQQAHSTILSDFLCSISLKGGPPQMSIKIAEDIVAYPPCFFYLPPGNYSFESSFPGFATRIDSVSLLPGRSYSKRILLLPE